MKIAVMLEGLSFDWSTFDPDACSIGGVSTADFLAAAVDKLTLFEEFWQSKILQQATAATVVDLGSAGDYTILTKSGISTVPASVITGNIAVSPIAATAMTGFSLNLASNGKSSTSSQVTGTAYAASYLGNTPSLLTTAILNMETAYTAAANVVNNDDSKKNLFAGEIGGQTLTPGVYTFASNVNIATDIILNGAATDTFIIQMTGNLLLAANKKVILKGGVLAKNIFWQVAGNVKVMAGATMEGILLVKTDVTFITGSTLNGRVLAQTACVLDQATITGPK